MGRALVLLLLVSQCAVAQVIPYFPNGVSPYQTPATNVASPSVNAQTGTTYTLVLSDANNLVSMTNAASNTLTIPPHASVAFPVGTRLIVQQNGAGQTTINPGAGVTLTNAAAASVNGSTTQYTIGFQYGQATFRQTATDTWNLESAFTGALTLNAFTAQCMASGAGCPSIVARTPNSTQWLSFGNTFVSGGINGDFYRNYFGLNNTGDMIWETPDAHDQFFMIFDNSASTISGIYMQNDTGAGPIFGTDGSADTNCGYTAVVNPVTGAGCSVLDSDGADPLLTILDGAQIVHFVTPNSEWSSIGFSAGAVKWLQAASANTNDAQVTVGDSSASTSTTNIVGPTAANTKANGIPIATNRVGTSGSIGGSALVAGACSSGTVSITGVTVGQSVVVTPSTYPGDGAEWEGYVSASNTVTVKVCAIVALTPTASVYNVRVLN